MSTKLNDIQDEAANYFEGPLLILAGAGSGKTRVITYRISNMIESGIAPFQILAITFTNKAAREMKKRVEELVPSASEVWISTFHSLCVRILRKQIQKIGFDNNFTIYDSDDSERLMKRCVRDLNINDKLLSARAILSNVSGYKNEFISPSDAVSFGVNFREKQIVQAYTMYQQRLRENNALDFDDLIGKTVELFMTRPEVLDGYQNRFRYIMVDEYQDTNTAQYKLISLLSRKSKNLCVVGDDDQSIYGWRGANIRNILDFEKEFKGAKVVKLEQNYRSTQTILDAANAVIENNRGRKGKSLWTDKPSTSPIFFYSARYDYEEANFVTETIKKSAIFSDHAILYRTNAQSRTFEEQLIAKGLPYKIFGGIRFYDRKEIKDILAYLRVINNPKDSVSLLRIINTPRRGIGDSTVDKLVEFSKEHDISLFDVLLDVVDVPGLLNKTKKIVEFVEMLKRFTFEARVLPVHELVTTILDVTGYAKEIALEATDESKGRIENIEEFVSKAADFSESAEDNSLDGFLSELALVSDFENLAEESENFVTLMTYHSAKGLEFNTVFMVGFEESLFPSYRASMSENDSDLEEERRICYVGITRAMENLYICAAESRRHHGQIVYNLPSRFLKEIPDHLVENLKAKQPDQSKGERSGISQFAEVNKTKNAIDISFGGKNYASPKQPQAETTLDFGVGDKVRQMKYGVGEVLEIKKTGPDYEVSVSFEGVGVKKFMAHLCKLKKV